MKRQPEQLLFPWFAAELAAEAETAARDREQAQRDHAAIRRSQQSERERFAALAMN